MFKIVYRLLDNRCEKITCDSYEEAIGYCKIIAHDGCTFRLYEGNELIAKSASFGGLWCRTIYVSHTKIGFDRYVS
jgi:hypothetical protein